MAYDSPFDENQAAPADHEGPVPTNTGVAGPTAPPAAPPAAAPIQRQGWTRQNVMETLQRYGAPTTANLQRAVAENPWLGQVSGRGGITDIYGTGHTWDVIGNLSDTTGATTHWQTLTGNTARAKGGNKAPAAGSKPAASGAPTAVAPGSTSSANDPRGDELYNELLARSRQGLAVDRNDPAVRSQADAYAANQERTRRNYLGDVAEKSGPTANLRGEQRVTAEKAGQASGAFESQLIGREITAKRDEIAQALSSRQSYLSDQQRNALTKELAVMDDAVKRLAISTQDKQFGQNMNYQDRALAQNGSQFNANLAQNDNHFLDQLGFNYSDRSNYWDATNRGLLQ